MNTTRVSILIISHHDIGNALIDAAKMTYGYQLPLQIDTVGVREDTNPDVLLPKIKQLITKLDQGVGVLILTDLFGATPCNIAQEVQTEAVMIVSGLNLPMLIRVINYPDLPLVELAATALKGGQSGIVGCECKQAEREVYAK